MCLAIFPVIHVTLSFSADYHTLPTRLEIVNVEKKKGLSKYYVRSHLATGQRMKLDLPLFLAGVRDTSDVS